MSNSDHHRRSQELDAFLDGLLNSSEQREFDRLVQEDEGLRTEIELQRLIDDQLKQRYRASIRPLLVPRAPNLESELLSESTRSSSHTPTNDQHSEKRSETDGRLRMARHWRVAGLMTLAAVVWSVILWNLLPLKDDQVVFAERPLEDVYIETVNHGFEPYYICEDDERFRATFWHRHGQSLSLAEMPTDRRMVGLSYVPAISRHSTAMLAEVRGRPVMVFVDRIDHDRQLDPPRKAGLKVFRRELKDLVIYEVTPWDGPEMMNLLVPADAPPESKTGP